MGSNSFSVPFLTHTVASGDITPEMDGEGSLGSVELDQIVSCNMINSSFFLKMTPLFKNFTRCVLLSFFGALRFFFSTPLNPIATNLTLGRWHGSLDQDTTGLALISWCFGVQVRLDEKLWCKSFHQGFHDSIKNGRENYTPKIRIPEKKHGKQN